MAWFAGFQVAQQYACNWWNECETSAKELSPIRPNIKHMHWYVRCSQALIESGSLEGRSAHAKVATLEKVGDPFPELTILSYELPASKHHKFDTA